MENDNKMPRHSDIAYVATRHLLIQRERAIADRSKADNQVKDLEAALVSLGWNKQLSLIPEVKQ